MLGWLSSKTSTSSVIVPVAVVSVLMLMSVLMSVIAVPDHEFVGTGRQLVRAGPFERVLRLEKPGIEIGGATQVEPADIEHVIEIHVAVFRAVEPGHGVDAPDAGDNYARSFSYSEMTDTFVQAKIEHDIMDNLTAYAAIGRPITPSPMKPSFMCFPCSRSDDCRRSDEATAN